MNPAIVPLPAVSALPVPRSMMAADPVSSSIRSCLMRRCPVMSNVLVFVCFTFCCVYYLLLSIKLVRLHSDVKQALAALDAFMTVIGSSCSSAPEVNPDD